MNDDNDIPANAREIKREEFDKLARDKSFSFGPWMQNWEAVVGSPYIPPRHRRVWGRLSTGEAVFSKGEES